MTENDKFYEHKKTIQTFKPLSEKEYIEDITNEDEPPNNTKDIKDKAKAKEEFVKLTSDIDQMKSKFSLFKQYVYILYQLRKNQVKSISLIRKL